jgi:hypothetical protein
MHDSTRLMRMCKEPCHVKMESDGEECINTQSSSGTCREDDLRSRSGWMGGNGFGAAGVLWACSCITCAICQ